MEIGEFNLHSPALSQLSWRLNPSLLYFQMKFHFFLTLRVDIENMEEELSKKEFITYLLYETCVIFDFSFYRSLQSLRYPLNSSETLASWLP